MTWNSLKTTLRVVNNYFSGDDLENLKHYIKYYDDDKFHKLNAQFHSVSISSPEIKPSIEVILNNLGIAQAQRDEYFCDNLTIYDFLLRLNRENPIQVGYLLELIEKKKQFKKLKLLFGGLLTVSTLYFLLSFRNIFNSLITIFQEIFPINLPAIGLAISASYAFYDLCQVQFNKKRTLFNRIRDNFFGLTRTTITIVAYGLWIALGTLSITSLIGCLFVAASAIDIVKEVVSFIQESHDSKKSHKVCVVDNHATNIRHTFSIKQHKRAAIINCASAVFLVGIMAMWCFAPGGIVVSIIAMALITATYLLKSLLLTKSAKAIRIDLQKALKMANDVKQDVQLGADIFPKIDDNCGFFESKKSSNARFTGNTEKQCPYDEESSTNLPAQLSFFSATTIYKRQSLETCSDNFLANEPDGINLHKL